MPTSSELAPGGAKRVAVVTFDQEFIKAIRGLKIAVWDGGI